MFFREILDLIRAKSRKEWSELVRERIVLIRIWLQENGEIAALCGFVAGIIIILFFKLFIFLTVFGGLVAYTVFQLAGDDDR